MNSFGNPQDPNEWIGDSLQALETNAVDLVTVRFLGRPINEQTLRDTVMKGNKIH